MSIRSLGCRGDESLLRPGRETTIAVIVSGAMLPSRAAFAAARREHGTDSHAVAAAAGHYVVEALDARDMRQRVKLADTLMRDE